MRRTLPAFGSLLVLVLVSTFEPDRAGAQSIPETTFTQRQISPPLLPLLADPRLAPVKAIEPSRDWSTSPDAGGTALGATGGWVLGVLAGGLIGHLVDPTVPSEYAPVSNGAAAGALLGTVAGPSIGAHLGNRRQGNPLLACVGTAAASGGVFLLAQSFEREGRIVIVLAIPVVQVGTATLLERLTGR